MLKQPKSTVSTRDVLFLRTGKKKFGTKELTAKINVRKFAPIANQ